MDKRARWETVADDLRHLSLTVDRIMEWHREMPSAATPTLIGISDLHELIVILKATVKGAIRGLRQLPDTLSPINVYPDVQKRSIGRVNDLTYSRAAAGFALMLMAIMRKCQGDWERQRVVILGIRSEWQAGRAMVDAEITRNSTRVEEKRIQAEIATGSKRQEMVSIAKRIEETRPSRLRGYVPKLPQQPKAKSVSSHASVIPGRQQRVLFEHLEKQIGKAVYWSELPRDAF